jgi:glucose-1-phosphate thymidylyltransferase
MKAIVLAAGFSTRMCASGIDSPKALLPVGKKRIVQHVIDQLADGDLNFTLVTNAKYFDQFNSFLEKSYRDLDITIINDGSESPELRLGAIRDLQLAMQQPGWDEGILALACDTITSFRIEDIVNRVKVGTEIVNVVFDTQNPEVIKEKLGCVEIDTSEHVTNFTEKPKMPASTLTSVPYYYLPPKSLPLINDFLKFQNGDSPGKFIEWLIKTNHQVKALLIDHGGYYLDIGDKEAYNRLKELVADHIVEI